MKKNQKLGLKGNRWTSYYKLIFKTALENSDIHGNFYLREIVQKVREKLKEMNTRPNSDVYTNIYNMTYYGLYFEHVSTNRAGPSPSKEKSSVYKIKWNAFEEFLDIHSI